MTLFLIELLKEHSRLIQVAFFGLKNKYALNKLGMIWLPAQTILISLALCTVFGRLGKQDYFFSFCYIYSGLTVVLVTVDCFNRQLIRTKSMMLLQTQRPFHSIFLVGVYENLIELLIGTFILSFIAVYIHQTLDLGKLFLFILSFGMLMFSIFVFIALLRFFVPDFKQVVQLGSRSLIFISPVFWLPNDAVGLRETLLEYNILSQFLMCYRDIFSISTVEDGAWVVVFGFSILSATTALITLRTFDKFFKKVSF